MNRSKAFSGLMLTLLLIGMLILTFNIQPVKASGTIYIRADGSVDPDTAPISTLDNITYTFTDNINESIVVERNNTVVDGAGYTVQGTGGGTGIYLSGRSNVTIKNMEIKTFDRGVTLLRSSSNILTGNNITNNREGIELSESSNNTISGNNITNNICGIELARGSDYNTIFGNSVTNNWDGIELLGSPNNTLRNNGVSDNEYNFGVYASLLSHYFQDIDDSNTVDGKPVYYWVSRRDLAVPSDAGYVALVNCTRMTVENLNLTKNGQGVLLASTTNSTITKNSLTNNYLGIWLRDSPNNTISGNNITNNRDGIELADSPNNTISGNNITNNRDGIELWDSPNTTISGNNITKNDWDGIELWDSPNNTISGNNITNNREGIRLLSSSNHTISGNNITNNTEGIELFVSSNNAISGNNITNNWKGISLGGSNNNVISGNNITNNYRGIGLFGSSNNTVNGNNIIANNEFGVVLEFSSNNNTFHRNNFNNAYQARVTGSDGNIWDNSYLFGGNYWSDHICTGNPSDGSQPYIIDADNIDHYPFQDPNGWLLHQLTVTSSPMTGIPFTINGAPQTTPYTEWLPEGSYTLIMPQTHNGYVWSRWLEDGDTNRIKTITILGTTYTAVYRVAPVGGTTVSVNSERLSSWIASILLIISVVFASGIYLRKKSEKE